MNKKNLIYIGILLVLVFIYSWHKMQEPNEKRFKLTNKLNLENVAGIKLIQKDESLTIMKNGDLWEITEPQKISTDQSKAVQFFQTLKDIEVPATPVSENPAVFDKFGVVDSVAIQVVLLDKNMDKIEHYLFGNTRNYQFNAFRKADETKVYQLTTSISHKFRPTLAGWRNKFVEYIRKSDIRSLEVKYSSGEYKVTNMDSVWTYSDKDENFNIPKGNKQLMKIINGLENNRSYEWLDNDFASVADNFTKPNLTLTLEKKSGEIVTITFAKRAEDQKGFWMMRNQEKETLYAISPSWLDRFTKSAGHFKN
jgi:hypothetical protein